MYFFANMLTGFKGAAPTPATTSTQPHIDNHVTSADSDNNWEIITPEETAGFYTDRITLFLGPQLDQLYHILLTDIPRSSALLTYLATLDPAHRYLHIADVNTEMVAAYIRILNLYTDALAIEASWLDVIELAITAEVMQDERTENRALCVLRQKGVLAAAPGNSLYLFNDAEYAFARRYWNKTGKGENLIRVLREIGDVELERLGLPKRKKRVNHQGLAMFGSGTPAPFTAKSGNGAGLGYEHFRERDGKKDGSGGGSGGHRKKQHPTAQPCFATNVDVVRKKRPSNFFSYYMKGQQR